MTKSTASKSKGFSALAWSVGLYSWFDLRCARAGSESLAPARGGKARGSMKKKTADSSIPVGKLSVMADFLPPPEKLFPKEEVQKITLDVDSETVAFFKEQAKRHGAKYQRMIREVLKGYAKRHA